MKVRKLGRGIAFLAVCGSALVLWPAGCTGVSGTKTSMSPDQATSPAQIVKSDSLPKSFLPHPAFAYAKSGEAVSIADVAEQAAPSVVNVSSSRIVKAVPQSMPFFDDPMFRRFFGPMGPGPGEPGPRQGDRELQGLGSGVIVSADGIILTNNHVIDQADKIRVTTADKHEYGAKVIGVDPKSDLAVLRLEGKVQGLRPIELGDSSRLRLGDIVLAIGNPFAVGQTITMGIVSAKGRANVGITDYEDFIQTDAAINPGNSGGALVDMEGHLIGVNTAILSRTGGNMGIGFAIPSNMAKPIMQSLVDHGKVVRGWLGVGIQDIDQELATAMNLPSTDGVLVSEVMEGGPAAKAGLRRGDVVLSIDGVKMDSTGHLRNAIASAATNAEVKVEILREGKKQVVKVKLGEQPQEQLAGGKSVTKPEGGMLDGLTLESLGPDQRRKFDVPSSVKSGVVVTNIAPGSPAASAGLRPGDVILEVNRRKVTDTASFSDAYKSSKREVLLLVSREGQTIYMVLKR